MTAEIAILNKTAVSLATDSAVTISTGSTDQKIYDSADKLFQLSHVNPIGIMIYNGMHFMQAPLQTIICEYRDLKRQFERVADAADDFLDFLDKWGQNSPAEVMLETVGSLIAPVLVRARGHITKKIEMLVERIREGPADPALDVAKEVKQIRAQVFALFDYIYSDADPVAFVGGSPPRFTKERIEQIEAIAREIIPGMDDAEWATVLKFSKDILLKTLGASGSHTGIVIAGFGSKDLFPTLISFEIDGIIFGKLRYNKTNVVDIDRNGERARVIPFAQKEMVERFLYGLDAKIEAKITNFCESTVPEIRRQIFDHLILTDDDRAQLVQDAQKAESAFVDDLKQKQFEEIRSESKKEIEDMVEFMPKPELATMAEALVNLTSIKRRVSRGFETVGGPIDVAVISRTDGFIWVKRKHYFSAELNPRYVQRVAAKTWGNRGSGALLAAERTFPRRSQGGCSPTRWKNGIMARGLSQASNGKQPWKNILDSTYR